MILLRKKINDNNYFDFEMILASGYIINEDHDRITQKFINGRRKQIISRYTDCTIGLKLGTFDLETTKEYLDMLTTGTYQYYSIKDKTYKEAQFLVEKRPEIVVNNSANENMFIDDFDVMLLKAGD